MDPLESARAECHAGADGGDRVGTCHHGHPTHEPLAGRTALIAARNHVRTPRSRPVTRAPRLGRHRRIVESDQSLSHNATTPKPQRHRHRPRQAGRLGPAAGRRRSVDGGDMHSGRRFRSRWHPPRGRRRREVYFLGSRRLIIVPPRACRPTGQRDLGTKPSASARSGSNRSKIASRSRRRRGPVQNRASLSAAVASSAAARP